MNEFVPGGVERPKDKRDFKLGQYQAPQEIPKTYATDISLARVHYQNGWPTCGANAGTHLKEIQEALQYGTTQDYSPRFLWRAIKDIDGHPLEVGTDSRSLVKAVKTMGVADYSLLPNDYSQSLALYSRPSISSDMYANAKPRGINGYAFINSPTVEELKQAIFQNKVVILLMWVDDGFFGTSKPTYTQKYKYGHFVVAYGYNDKEFLLLDSTERNTALSTKIVPFSKVDFVREVATVIDLSDTFIFKNNLRVGMRNEEVRELQKRLNMTSQTGFFGPLTFIAVQKYQRDNGIIATGFVGPLTRAKLNTT